MNLQRVKVTEWCDPAESRECLRLILGDVAEIDAALASSPWISPKRRSSLAIAFRDCIVACGGKAEIVA